MIFLAGMELTTYFETERPLGEWNQIDAFKKFQFTNFDGKRKGFFWYAVITFNVEKSTFDTSLF